MPVDKYKPKTGTGEACIPFSTAGQQIRSILDALPFYVILVDARHKILAVNQRMLNDFGVSPEQLVGKCCPAAVHGTDFPVSECPLAEAVENGEPVEREIYDSRTGRWMLAAVFPTQLVTNDGEPVFFHSIRDITDVKNTEETLSQSLEHYSALCGLLQRFQHCQTGAQIMEALINEVVSLSWLRITSSAVGFLANDSGLEMVARHNVPPGQLACCHRIKYGECLCGKVAQSGRSMICSSASREHSFKPDGMDDHHHAVLPLSHEGRVFGVATFYLKPGDELNPFRMNFLNAAASAAAAALAVVTAQEEVKQAREKSLAQMISYQEDERKRLSRELHDQVCQSLSALLLEMQAHDGLDERLNEIRRGCEARVRGLIDEVRHMAGHLRPTILDDYGLEKALARYIEELSKSGLEIDYQYVSYPDSRKRLSPPVEVALYRVAVEALDNIVAHASASRASVVILWQNSKLTLIVEDDGTGFDYPATRRNPDGSLGITGMKERVSLMGGTFRIESSPQKGTTVRAEIPVDAA